MTPNHVTPEPETAGDPLTASCPLCHTVNEAITPEALTAGAIWECARCSQIWDLTRLRTAAAYADFAAARV